jgi:hypothetical protein
MTAPTSTTGNATSSGRVTRARQNQPIPTDRPPNRQELIESGSASSPKNTAQARAFLHKKGFLSGDDTPTQEALSYALLSMAYSAPERVLQDGARAIAVILMEQTASSIGEEVASCVEKFLQPIAESMTNITNNLEEVAEEVKNGTKQRGGEDGPARAGPNNTFTYAAALKGNVPLLHHTTLARARTRNCQVLIDSDPNASGNPFAELNEQELVAKANEALDLSRDSTCPEEGKFIGARKLTNGGIVFDLNTIEATRWIQKNKGTFTPNCGATAIVKDRALSVIVEYVPIAHSTDALSECRKVERDSGLSEHSLLSTRWIKNPARRTQGQRTAHIIARFSSNEAANIAIRDGLIIAGK